MIKLGSAKAALMKLIFIRRQISTESFFPVYAAMSIISLLTHPGIPDTHVLIKKSINTASK